LKSSNPVAGSNVKAGDIITYYIDVINNGSTALRELPVRDAIPTGTTYVAGSASDGGALVGGQVVWTIADLAVGAVKRVSFQVTVNPLSANETFRNLRNVAVIVGPNGEEQTPEVPHIVVPDTPPTNGLYLHKSTDKGVFGAVVAGETITYYLTVTNYGQETQSDIAVTDNVPSGTTYVNRSASDGGAIDGKTITWNIARLNAGESKTVSFQVTVNQLAQGAAPFIIRNVGYINGKPGDPVENPVYPPTGANVVGAKRANPPAGSTVRQGDVITYYVDVFNRNGSAVSGITVRDPLPEGTSLVAGSISNGGTLADGVITWNIASMQARETITLSFQATVNALPQGVLAKIIRNQAVITSPGSDGTPPVEYPTNEVEHPNLYPEIPGGLYLNKRTDRPANARLQAGDTITYTLTATNFGRTDKTNVIVTDRVPSGTTFVADSITEGGVLRDGVITWIIPTLAAGASKELSFRVTVDALPNGVRTGVIRNAGYINGNQGEPVENPVIRPDGIIGIKRVNPASGTSVKASDTLTYSIDIVNTGASAKENIDVRDTVPEGTVLIGGSITNGGILDDGVVTWNIARIEAGQTITVGFAVVVSELPAGTVYRLLRNQAIVTVPDGNNPPIEIPTNEVENPQVPPVTPQNGELTLKKGVSHGDGQQVKAGDVVTYFLTASNSGIAERRNISISDSIPAGTTYVAGSATDGGTLAGNSLSWTLNLAAGESKTVSFQVTVNDLPEGVVVGTIRNVGYINGEPGNAVENPIVPPIGQGRVYGVKRVNPSNGAAVAAGDELTYSINVYNTKTTAVTGVIVRDTIPEGTTLVTGSISSGGTRGTDSITWTLDLAAGETKTVSFRVTVNALPDSVRYRTLRNGAVVVTPSDDPTKPDTETPTNEVENPVERPYLRVEKSADRRQAKADDVITYTITVYNPSGVTARDVVITDSIPTGTRYVRGSATPEADYASGVLTWTADAIAPRGSYTARFQVRVDSDVSGTIRNIAHAIAGNGDGDDDSTSNIVIVDTGDCDCGCSEGGDCDCEHAGDDCNCGGSSVVTPGNGNQYINNGTVNINNTINNNNSTTIGNITIGDITIGDGGGNGGNGDDCNGANSGVTIINNNTNGNGNGGNAASVGSNGASAGGITIINNNTNGNGNGGNAVAAPETPSGGSGNAKGGDGGNQNGNAIVNNTSDGKGYVPKTSEASALWAILVLIGSGGLTVCALIVRRKTGKFQLAY
jgi:uncharacterized repeat protein (TIGR01451 family)